MTYIVPGIPPSNNQYIGRKNYHEYQRTKKMWAERIALCCRPKPQKPLPRAVVILTYYFPDRRRRDPDNYAPKMILDGLVKCGILVDDSFQNIELILSAKFGCKKSETVIEVKELE